MTTDRVLRHALLAMLCTTACACGPRAGHDGTASGPAPAKTGATATAAASTAIAVADWPLPVRNARQPDLASAPDGSLLLSWTDGDGDRQTLRFARWQARGWSAPRTIAAGEGIGNTADTPHVRQTPDGALWATWLRKVGDGHARDIVLARSTDDGRTWSAPEPVNTDGTATEHGFASLWPVGRDALGVAWLDGRETADASHGHRTASDASTSMHEHAGTTRAVPVDGPAPQHATMLRTVVFDAHLARRDEAAIDTATCDCCQTDVAVLDDGPRLVYRDRTAGEVRDIAIVARSGSGWSAPRLVHADGWHMPACPVNGPAIAARGRDVAVAWYTMHDGLPTVRFARSRDGGATFDPAIDPASSADVLGRIDVASGADGAWVTWLTESGAGQALHAAHVAPSASATDRVVDVAKLTGRGRGTGWPKLVATDDGMRVVWTDVVDGAPVLRGARLGR